MGTVTLNAEIMPQQWQQAAPSVASATASSASDAVADPSASTTTEQLPFLHRTSSDDSMATKAWRYSNAWLYHMCRFIVRDLEKYGICVVDNFMGRERAERIHHSVISMYRSGVFAEGQTVTQSSLEQTHHVRGDKIVWLNGTGDTCGSIAEFIHTVDTVIKNAAVRLQGKDFEPLRIAGRTKAMVACYPGSPDSGRGYVKHVDNPSQDGRCITSTYYLNKDWNVKNCGGLLRVFPQGWDKVLDIEPVLDRLVLFWSDRRNPHEVQPSFRTRYAITIWYYDAKERQEAIRRYQRKRARQNSANPAIDVDE